jgi:C_GCAxxG_C_C family probable redox protein
MTRKEMEKKAFDYFNSGFCCSEALSKAIIEHFSTDPKGYQVRVASAFCGGIGKSLTDVCGALSGGIIAIGYLHGRSKQGEDINAACSIASEFRRQFIEAFGSTNCSAILNRLGTQKNSLKCKQLTGKAAGMLADILMQR